MKLGRNITAIGRAIAAETESLKIRFDNSTNKGNWFETIVRNFISTYTRNDTFITHGEITDSYGNKTGQIDFATVESMHPKGYNDGRPNIIIYDHLKTVGECKLLLNTSEFDKINNSFRNLLKLTRHPENRNTTGGEFYGQGDYYPETKLPPYFVVAFETNIAYKTLIEKTNFSEISLVTCINHKTSKKGLVILGKTHRNNDIIKALNQLGEQKEEYLWECDNPLLVLIWAINRFEVNSFSLTNLIPYYFGIKE